MDTPEHVYGLMAEFTTPEELLAAAEKTHAAGYTRTDAYSPYPIEGLPEALGPRFNLVPWLVMIAGFTGAIATFLMQVYATVWGYPINVGGRPLNSWPTYIPATFEIGILSAGFAAFISVVFLNGLPQPYHPAFNVPEFGSASQDSFFLAVEAKDNKFDLDETRRFLEEMRPVKVTVIDK